MARWLMALVCVALAAGVARAAEPVKMADDKDAAVLAGFLKHAEGVPKEFTEAACRKQAENEPEGITWIVSPQVDMLLTAYDLSKDTKYLDMFVQVMGNLRAALTKGGDGYLGWYGKPLGSFQDPAHPNAKVDVIITSFHMTELMARFVETASAEPALKAKYAKECEAYLDLAENHLVKKWVARGNYVDLGDGGAIFRTHSGLRFDKGNLTQPHNKHSIIIRAMLALYRVTGKDEYATIAVKLGTRFKRCLTLKDGHYEWDYWDPAGEWDVNPQKPAAWKHWIGPEHKGGYYSSSLSQAVALYQHGLVFTKEDMDRFLKTQLEMTWNGSMSDPKWFRVDHTNPAKYTTGVYMCAALAPFSEKVYEFVYTGPRQDERVKNATHGWQGGPVANGYLEGKYVSYPAQKGGKPQHGEWGAKFLAKSANATLVKRLAFEVTSPGYKAPQAPGEMKPMPKAPAPKNPL